ncbi:hypothetical protein THOM_0330 [Trachipleistophora hominis]|uniref:Uncharacterized protein n=1 Tax=Trachipleistophora hominis TaxID=72359 RepID=L7JYV3_TRAHO|nr:hypothetical protein THOM_0330 [Trachipleistophora hominis]
MNVRDLIRFYEDKIMIVKDVACVQNRIVEKIPTKMEDTHLHQWPKIVYELGDQVRTKAHCDIDDKKHGDLVKKMKRLCKGQNIGEETKASAVLIENECAMNEYRMCELRHVVNHDNWYVKPSTVAAREREKHYIRQSFHGKKNSAIAEKPSIGQDQTNNLVELANEEVYKAVEKNNSIDKSYGKIMPGNRSNVIVENYLKINIVKNLNEKEHHETAHYCTKNNSSCNNNATNSQSIGKYEKSTTTFLENTEHETSGDIILIHKELSDHPEQTNRVSKDHDLYKNHLYTGDMDVDKVKLILNCGERIKTSYLLDGKKK